MASKTFSRSRPINFDVNPSPETMYHFPISPSEPGKFDFYRVHVTNHIYTNESNLSDVSHTPTLSSSTTTKQQRTPFFGVASSDQTKHSMLSNTTVTSTSQAGVAIDSSVLSNTNGKRSEPAQSMTPSISLTDTVKNALNKGYLSTSSNQTRRTMIGTTLSTKDLNHLSPQSM